MGDPDVHFVKFFHDVIREELELHPSTTHKRCLKRIQSLLGSCPNLCFSTSAMRCAYIYHYAPCLASTLHSHFELLVTDNPFLLQRIVLRQTFTVCCLCTGFPIDVAAMTQVLESMLRKYSSTRNCGKRWMTIDFAIVGIDSDWTATIQKMARKLSEESHALDFNIRFLTADFTMPLTDDVKQTLLQSDIVTMVHFLSTICKNDEGSRSRKIQDIVPFIRRGGVLFFLDFPERGDCNFLKETVESCNGSLIEIYGPLSYSVQRLRMLCRIECIRLYSRQYGWRCCALENASFVAALYKGNSECF